MASRLLSTLSLRTEPDAGYDFKMMPLWAFSWPPSAFAKISAASQGAVL